MSAASSAASEPAAAYVGLLFIELRFPGARSLKEKRAQVVSLVERSRRRFGMSVARVAGVGEAGWERIAFCGVSSDAETVARLLDKVLSFAHASGLNVYSSWSSVELIAQE